MRSNARVAHLTFGPRVRLASQPNVRCKSDTRKISLLVFLRVLTFALDIAAGDSKCQNRNTSVAHLTFGPRVRLASQPNVRCKSDTRKISLLVFLRVLTFALDIAAGDSKCQNRNTSVAHLTFGPRVRLASQPNVRCKSDTRKISLLVFLRVLTFALDIAARDSKCQNRNTSRNDLIVRVGRELRASPGRLQCFPNRRRAFREPCVRSHPVRQATAACG